MTQIINDLKEMFDYVVIDCPAGIEQGFKNAVKGADRAIVVVSVVEVLLSGMPTEYWHALEVEEIADTKLLVNRLRYNMVKKGDTLNVDDIKDILAIELY